MIKPMIVGMSALLLVACSATGLDSKKTFNCKLGDSVSAGCKSISETYMHVNGGGVDPNAPLADNGGIRRTPFSGMPVRTPEQVMRVWVAPWEDKDGDLRDQSYMYLTLRESRWQIAHNLENIVDDYRPTIRLLGADGAEKSVQKANDAQLPDMGFKAPASVDRTTDPSPLNAKPNLIPPPVDLP
ncbi:TraV family lipoprotein [Hydromonas duriensis]|uniref:Type IV conjugative transfer system lipoprotein TraV n=1 Tax=Hydromonas duriensis TaxID=1527608 RepID=A0A4R6Y5E9_9BURK|nr:TraV family lipoprotein [Hydromonas duriensis]TDR30287.1 type IV conjugative transfer system lipoprotein TraV [Hydromonas duriensis]